MNGARHNKLSIVYVHKNFNFCPASITDARQGTKDAEISRLKKNPHLKKFQNTPLAKGSSL